MKRQMMRTAVLIFALMMTHFASPSARASGITIYVPDNYLTIQEAIDAAVSGDIVMVRDGTYKLTAPIDFKGKAITVTSENGASHCFLDGQNQTRAVYFHSGEGSDSVLSGFTIQNGYAIQGAGIYCSSSSPTISFCTISGNQAFSTISDSYDEGGGIYCNASSPVISYCTITGNMAGSSQRPSFPGWGRGGGISIHGGSPVITNTTISGNQAEGYWQAAGGGIYVSSSSPSINNSEISNNSAWYHSTAKGGGIYFSTSTPSIVNSIISSNSAMLGAGIYFDQSSAFSNLTNCTIVRNTASTNGGGLYSANTSPKIINSILWEDSPQELYDDATSNPTITYSDVYGGNAGTGNIDTSPLFVSIAQQNYHLTSASLCVNAGSNAAQYLPLQDKDGNARIIDGVADMGAYEYYSAQSSDAIVYPQLAIGGGYKVTLLIQNNSTSEWKGRAEPLLRDGSLDYLMTDLDLAAGETQKLIFTGGSNLASTGLEIFGNAGNATSALSTAFFFTYSPNGIFKDSVGVPKGEAATKFTLPVEEAAPITTGIAVRRLPYATNSPIILTLRNAQGTQIGSVTRSSDFAMFVWQLFPALPAGFIGSMTVESDTEFYMIAFRMDQTDGETQFTTCPAEAR